MSPHDSPPRTPKQQRRALIVSFAGGACTAVLGLYWYGSHLRRLKQRDMKALGVLIDVENETVEFDHE